MTARRSLRRLPNHSGAVALLAVARAQSSPEPIEGFPAASGSVSFPPTRRRDVMGGLRAAALAAPLAASSREIAEEH